MSTEGKNKQEINSRSSFRLVTLGTIDKCKYTCLPSQIKPNNGV